MKRTVLLMVFSGLCFLPSSFSKFYIYVKTYMNWFDAHIYCRSQYTDLASVQNQQELAQLNHLIESQQKVWIGLLPDSESWRWSLENPGYYGAGADGLRMWAGGEPNEVYYKSCVVMERHGQWSDCFCNMLYPFICYNNVSGTSSSPKFIFVNQALSWTSAQSYCRQTYTDLASVRNQAENNELMALASSNPWSTYIGLYRDSWKWSDGSSAPFTNWNPGVAPTTTYVDTCVASYNGTWVNINCYFQMYFVCFVDKVVRKHVVRLVLKKADSSVDMERLTDDVLHKFVQILEDQELTEGIQVGWVKQPDGKVFHETNSFY